jgi:hypothetical protein
VISFEFFSYTAEQWSLIRDQVLGDLGVDVDLIERQVTTVIRDESFTGMQSLRERIQIAASLYHFHSSVSRRSPRRDELVALRKAAENLRASIIGAVTVQVGTKYAAHPVLLNGVDDDMLAATRNYFTKLAANLDRQIERARSRSDNARKPDRDQCWNELLALWVGIGGHAHGEAAAEFLKLTSLPVMNGAVPARKSIVHWLERRRHRRSNSLSTIEV